MKLMRLSIIVWALTVTRSLITHCRMTPSGDKYHEIFHPDYIQHIFNDIDLGRDIRSFRSSGILFFMPLDLLLLYVLLSESRQLASVSVNNTLCIRFWIS